MVIEGTTNLQLFCEKSFLACAISEYNSSDKNICSYVLKQKTFQRKIWFCVSLVWERSLFS